MNKLKMKPILILEEDTYEKLKGNTSMLVGLYGSANVLGESQMHLNDIVSKLTILNSTVSRDELKGIVNNGGKLMASIRDMVGFNDKVNITNLLNRLGSVKNIYNDIVGDNTVGKNKTVLTEVKKNNLLDLTQRYSFLTNDSIVDCEDFIILKVDSTLVSLLKFAVITNDVKRLLYGIYLNTNGIASNIDLNKRIDKNFLGSILPYIQNYA